ncbi:MAG: hypothetical protein HZA04_04250 [Nitrospinae bacterium]|nr:hypothetical protein [Nitrospinota bacterium]
MLKEQTQSNTLSTDAEKLRRLNMYKGLLVILGVISALVALGGRDLLSKGGTVPKTNEIALQTAIERKPMTQIANLLGAQKDVPAAERAPTAENIRDYQILANAIVLPFALISLGLFGGAAALHVSARKMGKDRN